ncbi:hypothetical protein FRB98_006785, partial [Tulasnella sp. 332]
MRIRQSQAWSTASEVTTYVFPSDTFQGPMEDQETGHVVYLITSKSRFAGPSTTITHADRSSVGTLSWGSDVNPMTATLRGRTLLGSQLLVSTKSNVFTAPRQTWMDDWGNEYYWKNGL